MARHGRRLLPIAALVCAIALVDGEPARAADAVAQSLYDQAVAARNRGDFAGAIDKLEAARRIDRNNIEVLTLLGMVYGFAGRYDDAQKVLEQAHRSAPKDSDIVLALARIKSYRNDFAGAQRDVASVLAVQPRNGEALGLSGRLSYYQGDLPRAERQLRAALAVDPKDVESLLGLGDVKAAQGDEAGARVLYERARVLAPNSPEIRERLARKQASPPLRFQLDSLLSWSHFARRPVQPWYETFNQLTYHATPATAVHARSEVSQRFGAIDAYYEAGVDHRFGQAISGYLYGGGTPNAHFRERWTALGGGTVRIAKGGDVIGGTLLTLDAKDSLYRTGFVRMASPGVQQYFLSGRVWLTGKQISSWVAGGHYLGGYLARADWLLVDSVTVYGGYAHAPETENNVTAQTSSVFGGVSWDVSPRVTLHLDYVHDDRQNSYIRHAVTFGAGVKF
jgi:YaiO family outer membrane protein